MDQVAEKILGRHAQRDDIFFERYFDGSVMVSFGSMNPKSFSFSISGDGHKFTIINHPKIRPYYLRVFDKTEIDEFLNLVLSKLDEL